MSLKHTSAFVGLIAGSAIALSTSPAQAVTLFGNNGIRFDSDTAANFDFVSSNGLFNSNFGVFDTVTQTFSSLFAEQAPGYDTPLSGDFRGTCPTTVPNCTATFNFVGGRDYSFALLTPGENTVYSTTALNNPQTLQANFSGENPFVSPVTVAFDDRGGEPDLDFNDFQVSVSTTNQAASVPEPASLGGLALMGILMGTLRRRQGTKVS